MDQLFKDIQLIQKQVDALLGMCSFIQLGSLSFYFWHLLSGCTFYLEQMDNVVILQCFKLLIGDMLALFHILNEGIVVILSTLSSYSLYSILNLLIQGHYFDMSKTDASKALQIYKAFSSETKKGTSRSSHDMLLLYILFSHSILWYCQAPQLYPECTDP